MHFTEAAIIAALIDISPAVQCNFGSSNAQTKDARTCADLLKDKGGQSCTIDPHGGSYPPRICHQGAARVCGVFNNCQAVSISWSVCSPFRLPKSEEYR